LIQFSYTNSDLRLDSASCSTS